MAARLLSTATIVDHNNIKKSPFERRRQSDKQFVSIANGIKSVRPIALKISSPPKRRPLFHPATHICSHSYLPVEEKTISSPSEYHVRCHPAGYIVAHPSLQAEEKTSRRQFKSPQDLSEWLKQRMPEETLAAWDKPGRKNVDNLWLEILEGKSYLVDSNPPVREVECAVVHIKDIFTRRKLLEAAQMLSDGIIRLRHRPLCKKMKIGESLLTAAPRAVCEELGIRCDEFFMERYKKVEEERLSNSYVGLHSRYVLHNVEAMVAVPKKDFFTDGSDIRMGKTAAQAKRAVHVKRRFWLWYDCPSMPNIYGSLKK